MGLSGDRDPIGQFVVERVPVVHETAFLNHQATGVGAGPSGHPSKRAAAGGFGDRLDAVADVFALDLLGQVLVIDPAVAVADDLVSGLDDRSGDLGVALKRSADRQHADLDVAFGENSQQPPHAAPRAVFVDLLDKHAAPALHRWPADVGQHAL